HLHRCFELQGSSEDSQFEWLYLRLQMKPSQEAERTLWKYINENHAHSAAMLEILASRYAVDARYHAARLCIERWLELEPKNVRALSALAMVADKTGAMEAAERALKEAVELAPELWRLRLQLANILLETADPAQAESHIQRLLRDHA